MSIAYYERICQEDIDIGTTTTEKRNPGGGTITGTQVNLHTFAIGQTALYQSWAVPSLSNSTSTSQTFVHPGAALGDFVLVSYYDSIGGLIFTSYVSAPDEVTVVATNLTGSVVTLATANINIIVFKTATAQYGGGGGE